MTPPRRRNWNADRFVIIAVSVIALTPLLMVVLTRSFRHWTPTQDMAVIDLRVRDVFGPNTPLTGPYSRYGWNHLGPFEFWTVALLGLPFGRPAWATLVGHAVLQLAPLALLAWAALRASRTQALCLAAFVAVSYASAGTWMVLEPWNPHVAFAYWIAFLGVAWLVLRGRRELIVAGAVLASILVQLHVGYAPLVAVPIVLLAVWSWRDARDQEARRGLRRSAGWAVLASAVLWVPVVVDEVIHRPGNLENVLHFFRTSSAQSIGLGRAAGIFGEGFALPPNWWGRPSVVDGFEGAIEPRSAWWLLVALACLAAAALAARTVGRWAVRVVVLDAAMVVIGVVTLSRVTGAAAPYLFYWRAPLAIFVWLTCLSIVGRALLPRVPAPAWRPRIVTAVAVALVLVVGVRALPLAWRVATAPERVSRLGDTEAITERFLAEIERQGLPRDPVEVRFAGGTILGLHGGVVDGLDRLGVDVRTEDGLGFQFGYARASERGVGEVWYALETGALLDVMRAMPGARVVASATPLDRASEERVQELDRRLAASLIAAGRGGDLIVLDNDLAEFTLATVPGIDTGALREVAELNRRRGGRCRCAIVAFPAASDPDFGSPGFFDRVAATLATRTETGGT